MATKNETAPADAGLRALENEKPPAAAILESLDASTLAVHADDILNTGYADVAPALHVATTFRYSSNPDELISARDATQASHKDYNVYSRETAPSSTRLETILAPLLHAPCATYASGLAALHAFYVFFNPRKIAIGQAYHGSHGVVGIHARLTGATILPLDCDPHELGEGDVVHLETPVNPTGEAYSIYEHAQKAHGRGALLLVDSTFAPPTLQDPFRWGADVVMHSGTKYLGGHSDMLCGVLASQNAEWIEKLRAERTYLGSVMGSMESWLGVRSVRTLELRVERQSVNAGRLVHWLDQLLRSDSTTTDDGARAVVQSVLAQVRHASLQAPTHPWLKDQMPNGYGPVFAMLMKDETLARRLPSKTRLFHHATSLGGVESLMEWRAMSDTTVDRRLVRISVGIEAWQDLQQDLLQAFRQLSAESALKA